MVLRLALVAVLALTACTTQPNTPNPAPSPTPTVVPPTVVPPTVAQYFVREPLQSITELIYSWPTMQVPLVERITDALPRCTRVTGTSSVRTRFSIVAKQVRVPGLKDGIAIRSEMVMADTPTSPSTDYSAVVARDGTVLQLWASSDALTDAAFAQLLTKAVARLDAVR